LKSNLTAGAGKFLKLQASSPVSPTKQDVISYAQGRACFRSGEIRILDTSGNVKRAILSFNLILLPRYGCSEILLQLRDGRGNHDGSGPKESLS
jgi:hypothetical protein